MDVTCPACRNRGCALSLTVEERYRLIRCRGCRTQYFRRDDKLAPEAVSDERLSRYWGEAWKFELYTDAEVQRQYSNRYDSVLKVAESHLDQGRTLLDVGC